VGSARWEALKSYHHLGIAMLILYGLLLSSKGGWGYQSVQSKHIGSSSSHVVSET
jgi:hypothetical protein